MLSSFCLLENNVQGNPMIPCEVAITEKNIQLNVR